MISLVVIIKNEEKRLESFKKYKNIFDEIIFIDTGSTDNSLYISKEITDKVYTLKFNGNFSEIRNYAMQKASMKWILFLDADEDISIDDIKKIKRHIKQEIYDGYYLYWINYFTTNKYEITYKMALLKNNPKIYFEGLVHEQPIYSLKKANLKIKLINVFIRHFGFLDNQIQIKNNIYKIILSKQIKLGIDPSRALNLLSIISISNNDPNKAIKQVFESLRYESSPLEKLLSYYLLGTYKQSLELIDNAIEYYFKGVNINKQFRNDIEIKNVSWYVLNKLYYNLANCFEKKMENKSKINKLFALSLKYLPFKKNEIKKYVLDDIVV